MKRLVSWCCAIPKVELHAHLNGSLRSSTLACLAKEHGLQLEPVSPLEQYAGQPNIDRQVLYKECFKLFSVIHGAVSDIPSATRVAREVVEDFATDNVRYTELRTTPRALSGSTKRQYLDSVLSALSSSCTQNNTYAGLLCSLSRDQTPEEALDTAELATQYFCSTNARVKVVGVELSGNPYVRTFQNFLPALQKARSAGLPISLHFAERPGRDESMAMLDFRPERIGHGVYLDADIIACMLQTPIPLEVCLSSNVMTATIPDYSSHPFGKLRGHNYPLAICTDDMGVFCSNLSSEYSLAAAAYGLTKRDLVKMAANSLQFSFAPSTIKQALEPEFDAWQKKALTEADSEDS